MRGWIKKIVEGWIKELKELYDQSLEQKKPSIFNNLQELIN